ncbi:MAG: glycosyltransferase family 4 protein [Oligoflexia bacterium]|nr:glycosyltransferase family 4 protein [Oligoflexia bacterium]
MNIGHVSLTYRPVFGGQDTYIENLKQVLSHRGHKSTVYQAVSLRHKIDKTGVHAVLTPPGFGRFIANFNWYYFNFFLKFFKSKLAKEDVLIVHYAVHYPAVKFHPRVIILSHGIEWHTPADQWDDALRARRARETFKKCFVVANDTEYLRFCGVDIKPATRFFEEVQPGKWFVPNCVDTEHFKKVTSDQELAKLKPILVPRNIYYHRGIHLALEAFGLLVHEGNTENSMVIVGKIVDQEYYKNLLEIIKKYNIKDRVYFRGHSDWQKMPALYSASVCTIIPTIDCEGTSLSALESMACGTPVIATSVAGLKDLPCLHSEPEPMALKNALFEMLNKREHYATRQQNEVIKTFNLKNWEQAWTKIIEKASV